MFLAHFSKIMEVDNCETQKSNDMNSSVLKRLENLSIVPKFQIASCVKCGQKVECDACRFREATLKDNDEILELSELSSRLSHPKGILFGIGHLVDPDWMFQEEGWKYRFNAVPWFAVLNKDKEAMYFVGDLLKWPNTSFTHLSEAFTEKCLNSYHTICPTYRGLYADDYEVLFPESVHQRIWTAITNQIDSEIQFLNHKLQVACLPENKRGRFAQSPKVMNDCTPDEFPIRHKNSYSRFFLYDEKTRAIQETHADWERKYYEQFSISFQNLQ